MCPWKLKTFLLKTVTFWSTSLDAFNFPFMLRVHLINKSAFLYCSFVSRHTFNIWFFFVAVWWKCVFAAWCAKKEPEDKLQFQWIFFFPFQQQESRLEVLLNANPKKKIFEPFHIKNSLFVCQFAFFFLYFLLPLKSLLISQRKKK